MWTSTLDLDPKRVLVIQLLRRIWRGACFSSFAPLQVQNLPRQPLPATSWVRVRNRLAGICGSDLHMIQADGDFRIAPAAVPQHRRSYPGHEVVGEVLEIGEDVQQLHVGDRVVLQYGPNCLSTGVQLLCRSCAEGNFNLCEHGKLPGLYPIGGGWSEEMLLHEQQLFRVPTDISDDQAVLLEPASVAVHAVLRSVPRLGDRVLIIGAGTIGLLTLQAVRALAPQAEVSVLARHPFQIEQATRLGAAHIIYPQDSYTGIQRATGARLYEGSLGNKMLLGGYDVIYDTVGSKKTLHHALRWARAQSTVILVGLSLHMMRIDLTPIWYQEVNLLGSFSSGIETWPLATNEQRSTFEVTAELIKRRQLHPEQLITHRFPLNKYQAAVMTASEKAQSRAIKVVFDYSLLPASVVPTIRASAPRQRRSAASLLPLDDQDTPEEQPFPMEALASSTSVAPSPSTSIALSPAASPQEDDDAGELEDTVKAPAIVTRPEPVLADTQTTVQQPDEPVDIQILPTIPVKVAEPNDEPLPVSQETSEPSDDEARQTPSAVIEPVEQLDTTAQETSENFAVPATGTTQDTPEYSELPIVPAQDIPDSSASSPVEEVQTLSEMLEQLPSENIFDEPEQTAAMTTQNTIEDAEPSTTLAQDEPAPPDHVQEEETEGVIATKETENALLHVEELHAIQVRPRARARKKNNRATRQGSK